MKHIKPAFVFLFFTFLSMDAHAQYLTPRNIYAYAKMRNYRALESVRKYINEEDFRGQTPTCMAAVNKDWQTYHVLVQYGADPEPDCLTPKQLAQARQYMLQQSQYQANYAAYYGSKTSASNGTFLGMGALGWTVAGAAAAGVGVAVAAGGGGGGGGGGACTGFVGDDGKCYEILNCVHGYQKNANCICDMGYKGRLCDETAEYNNYNKFGTIDINIEGATTDVVGLEYLDDGDKIGPDSLALYNGYHQADTPDSALNKTFTITVSSSNPQNVSVYGLKNTKGSAYNAYIDGTHNALAGTLNATIDLTAAETKTDDYRVFEMYGIYAKGDVETIKKINADDVNATSNISLTFNTDQETTNPHETSMYGIKSTEGSVVNSQNSIIDLWYSNSFTDERHKIDLYGIDAAKDVINKGDIWVYGDYDNGTGGSVSNKSYGILSSGAVTNNGLVNVETKAQSMTSYGISAEGSVDNTDGTVTISSDTDVAVYGIYTNSTVDMAKIGTVSSTNSAFGIAVGVHFGSGSIELTDENVQNLSVAGKYIRYLFEGEAGTTITSSATIDAGLKAGTVNSSGKITGALYGIYATESANNTGLVSGNYGIYTNGSATNSGTVNGTLFGIYAKESVSSTSGTVSGNYGIYTDGSATNNGTVNGGEYGIYAAESVDNTGGTVKASAESSDTVYGIYTNGAIDMAKIGTVSSKNSSSGRAVGVHFGSGSIELTEENTQHISVSGGRERYLFEGEAGTTITNAATIGAGLKASNINNSGNITGGEYGIYATDSVDNTGGTVSASADTGDTVYGIYTNGTIDMAKIGTVSSTNSSSGKAVGVHFGSGSITLTEENTQNITTSGGRERYLFEGEAGTTITNTATIGAGLKASTVNNSGNITGGQYGIYATESADNTGGTVTASADTGDTVYGIYTNGAIDMEKIGTVSSTNTNTSDANATAVGVHFGSGSIELTDANTQHISASGGNIRYLFEGDIGTTITNAATINAGLKAAVVNNSGNVNGGRYGIYAIESVNNTGGTVTALTNTSEPVYGIYTDGAIDMNKIGTVSSTSANTSDINATAVGVHFGSGSIELTDENTQNISVVGTYIRYLFEGGIGTTITNTASIGAGLKAGTVNNSGNIIGGRYGIYAHSQVDNTGGSVTSLANINDTVYGIYTEGAIDMDKIGTVSSTNINTDPSNYQTAAVGVHFGSGSIELTDTNTQHVSATSANIRYLFEGDAGTTITNTATIDAGLKASIVNNSGNITGGKYGIYATESVDNTGGTVTALENLSTPVYGIYTDGAIDMNKLGTVSSANSSFGAAVGVRFGSGSIELTNANTQHISATSSNIRYLFEGAEGTTITNEATINAGLKAGIVNNTGNISGGQYGIYATEFVDNTGGTVTASTNTGDTVYGIYTDGAIDMNKLGEISSTNTNPSAVYTMAVGVHFGSGSIKLTDENTQNISVTGGRIRYLFEGDVGTTITNTASISAGLKASVVKNSGDIVGGTYGIYASESVDNTDGTVLASESISDSVYGIYTNGAIDMNKIGTIISVNTNTSSADAAAVGVHFGSGSIELTDQNVQNIAVSGGYTHYLFEGGAGTTITNTATLNAGLKGYTIHNSGTINGGSYGIYGQGTVTNSGTVESTGSGPAVYINGGSLSNQSSGLIKLNGSGYAVQLTNANLNNQGTISIVSNATSLDGIYGVYAENGSTIRNSGTIQVTTASDTYSCTGNNCYQGKTSSAPFMYLDSTSSYISQGLMLSYSPLNFNQDFGQGNVLLSTGGSFNAPTLSGNLGIASEVVSEGFEENYVLPNAIISDNVSGLNLTSQSALFDATLVEEDVVLTKKNFADVIDNSSLATFLENNYNSANNENLFKMLKGKENVAALNNALSTLTGADVFSRFTFEDLTMMRDLNADVNNKLFENTKDHLQIAGSVTPWNFDGNSNSNSRYALYNTVSGNRSYGLSFAFADLKSNDGHHNNNSRHDKTFYMGVPMGYEAKGMKLISTPTFGYAYGTYDRDGYNGASYEGKIEKRMFGFANEARYPFEAYGFKMMPTAEFNVFGYHIKGHEELKAYSLNIPAQNNLSVESGIGFNLAKQTKLGKNQNLNFNAGIMLYHEFANPYELDLSMNGMDGSFRISDERRKADRAVLRTGFDYKFDQNMSVTGGFAAYFDGTQNTKANLNFKYDF